MGELLRVAGIIVAIALYFAGSLVIAAMVTFVLDLLDRR